MNTRTHRKRTGFTIIELLVVVVVLGILASMAVARYMTYRDRSHIAAATCDLDLIRRVLACYTADWNSYPATAADYADLQSQLVDAEGNPLGTLPIPFTFEFLSYSLDSNEDYVLRARAHDNGGTVLVATPETITRE